MREREEKREREGLAKTVERVQDSAGCVVVVVRRVRLVAVADPTLLNPTRDGAGWFNGQTTLANSSQTAKVKGWTEDYRLNIAWLFPKRRGCLSKTCRFPD